MVDAVNNLEKSLISAATNPSARPQFYRDLLESDIYIIKIDGNDLNIQDNVVQADSQLKIEPIGKDGSDWLPIFSSLPRLQQFINHESSFLKLNARDFFEITRGAQVVLNPGFEYGKEFLPHEIAGILDGTIFKPDQTYVAKKDTEVLLGQPAIYPKELVKALSEYLAKNQFVNRAFLAQIFNRETDEKSHLIIGIDGNGDWDKVIGDAGLIASEVLGKGEVVDFIRIDGTGISKYMIDETRPFYQKSFLKKLFG